MKATDADTTDTGELDTGVVGTAEIDIDRVRADTPAVEKLIHFNNAGASLPPTQVVDRVKAHLDLEAAVGGYEAATEQADADVDFYASAAQLLACQPHEVAFCTSASEAWWRAFSAVPLEPGDRIVTGRAEYVANALGLIQARAQGIEVVLVDNDEHGQIDLDGLTVELDKGAKLVALTHVPTSSGLVNPAAEVGALARQAGAWYLLDACQSAGQLPLDVDELQCDLLSLTGRKFLRGPRGTGLLYARADRIDQLSTIGFIDGHSAQWKEPWSYELQTGAQRFELFEKSYAAKFGLGTAIDYALHIGVENIAARVARLAARLRAGLETIEGVAVLDEGRQLCGIVTFTVDGVEPATIAGRLRANGINTSSGSAMAAQFDLGIRGIQEMVRASVHYFNTDCEIDQFLESLTSLIATPGPAA